MSDLLGQSGFERIVFKSGPPAYDDYQDFEGRA